MYKSTTNFWGQKLHFLNFLVRISWKTFLLLATRDVKKLLELEINNFTMAHFTQFSSMSVCRLFDDIFGKMLTKSNMWISNEPFKVWRDKKLLYRTGKIPKRHRTLSKQLDKQSAKCALENLVAKPRNQASIVSSQVTKQRSLRHKTCFLWVALQHYLQDNIGS